MKPYSDLYPHTGLMLQNTEQVAEKVIVLPTGTEVDEESIQLVTSIVQVFIED